ncbi:hypothetical protein FJZ36_03290 [Candidatus Poribacteria bacterium]|nr:hypothetical protein [Candidatus Poribacteria bacterium]
MDNDPTHGSDTGADASAETGLERSGPVWEDPRDVPLVTAFFQTVVAVLGRPKAAFATMRVSPSIGRAYLFTAVPGIVSAVISSALQGATSAIFSNFMPTDQYEPTPLGTQLMMGVVATAVLPFVFAAVLHLLLIVAGAAKNGYAATFRVLAYVGGSCSLFVWVPCVGALVALVWGIYLWTVGVRGVHETSTARAATAVGIFVAILLTVAIGVGLAMALSAMSSPGFRGEV